MRRLALIPIAAAALAASGCATGQTGDPETVAGESAVVAGSVVSSAGGQVEYWVQYGPTTAYGAESAHQTIATQQNTPTGVRVLVDGLARSTTYHYRLCAQDGSQQGGPGCGEDRTVKTQSFECGETVSANVRFTGDAFCQSGGAGSPGIVIGAPAIEIDMHGFEIGGIVFVGGGSEPAIDNSGGFDDVTIRDGGIGNFGDGIHLENASRNRILHVSSFGPQDGIDISGGEANEVRHSNTFGRNSGLVATNTTGLIVADSTASGAFGHGMVLGGLVGSRIVRSQVIAGGNPCCTSVGIAVAGNGNVIKDNRIGGWNNGNIRLGSGADNKLLDNEVFDGFFPFVEPGASDSAGDGIFVGALTAGTIVRGNHAHGNDGDGIEVQGTETRITDNTADANGDFGIDAVAGVIDGGGNMASGNGNPLQCRNVFFL
jgi:parallel beta-helix repeat protein